VKVIVSALAWISGILGLVICMPLLLLNAFFASPQGISSGSRVLMRVLIAFFFVRVTVRNIEEARRQGPCVFMANHASFFDHFALAAYLPGLHRGMEAGEHFSWPIWGTFLRKAGFVAVDRSSAAASMRSMKQAAAKVADEGVSMLILPEGTRSRDGKMLPFNRLPFSVPRAAGCPLVPVGLKGTFRIKNKNSWLLQPGRIELTFGEPISADDVQNLSAKELAALTRDRIATLIGEAVEEQEPA